MIFSITGCSSKTAAGSISTYSVEKADYNLNIDAANTLYDISDLLYGIFFEDISFAADGGLYAEKVANRSFEFTSLAENDSLYAWENVGGSDISVISDDQSGCLNENNPSYLLIKNTSDTACGIENKGFMEGMSLKEEKYTLSFYAKALENYTGPVILKLTADGETAAEGKVEKLTSDWQKYELELTSSLSSRSSGRLQLLIEKGQAAFDMISLFPEDTYKGRENGLRNDLATLLEDLHPRFLRFPGGCVTEGYNENSAYNWKQSVGAKEDGTPLEFNGKYGDVAARKQSINIWTDINATDDPYPSFMTYGLGFYEFFLLSEDIGALGVPVLNAGLYCQGRQGQAVDMSSDDFKSFLEEMHDLIEFCRGGDDTVWGKVRISMGHPEPFKLEYICIGNENWGQDYYERYDAFLDSFNKAKEENPDLYKDIKLIYSSGPSDALSGNPDYIASFEHAKEKVGNSGDISLFAGAVDSHYYKEPGWMLKNTDYYDPDNYTRTVETMTDMPYGGAIPVFLGEYASQSNTLNSALSEAAYMTGLERNGDIVKMACYAPLFSSTTAGHWSPNLIWFNNDSCQPSANYYIQKLFSDNAGSALLASTLEGALIGDRNVSGMAGVGTWFTKASFSDAVITDNTTGEILYSSDFSSLKSFKKNWQTEFKDHFSVNDNNLINNSIGTEYNEKGSVAFFGDASCENYTYTVKATKLEGDEGFFIPFAVKDSDDLFYWNIGGYGNTVSCLQEMIGGQKSGQITGTIKDIVIEEGRTYSLKIVVDGSRVKCYIDDDLYVDYDASSTLSEAYQVVSLSDDGDIIIKLVNLTGEKKTFSVNIEKAGKLSGKAKLSRVYGESLGDENILGEDEKVSLENYEIEGIASSFNCTVPNYSATVLVLSRE